MFRVETIPLVLGVIVALIGLAILAYARLPENHNSPAKRAPEARVERWPGEAAIGISVLCMAAALIGRDTWRYSTVAMIAGAVLFFFGVLANRRYLRERLVNRGALRRGAPESSGPKRPPPKGPLMPR